MTDYPKFRGSPPTTYAQVRRVRTALLKMLVIVPFAAAFAAISALVPSGRAGPPVGNPVFVVAKAIFFTPKGVNPLGLMFLLCILMVAFVFVRFVVLWLRLRREMR